MYCDSEAFVKSSYGALSVQSSAGPAFGVYLQQSWRSWHSNPEEKGVMLSNPVVLYCVPPNDSQSKQLAVPPSCTTFKLNKISEYCLSQHVVDNDSFVQYSYNATGNT